MNSNASYAEIVRRAPKLLHPKCSPPGWWARRKLRIKEDDVWRCPICGIRHSYSSNLFGAIFWQTTFDDCGKSLVVHYGYDPERGMLAHGKDLSELIELKRQFQEPR